MSWTVLSNLVYGVYQWLLLAILAKVSGATDVGAFSLALGIVVPVQMFFNLQLRALQASDAKNEFPFSTYLALRIVGITTTALVVGLILASGWVPRSITLSIIGVLAVKSVESLSDVVYGLFQHAERLDLSSKSRLLESLCGLVIFGTVFAFTSNILITMLAVAAGLIGVLVLVTLPALQAVDAGREVGLRVEVTCQGVTALFLLGLPLGVSMGLANLSSALPRYILERFTDTAEVGVFAALNQLIVSGVIITGAIGQAVTPRMSKSYVAGDLPQFKSMVNKLILLGAAIGFSGMAVAWLLGAEILRLLYSDEFVANEMSLVIMAGSAVFLFAASFQGYALTAARVIRAQVPMLITVVVVALLSLIILVPKFGIEGAAWSSVIVAATQFVVGAILLRLRLHQISMEKETIGE